jgi:hypothetical protein
MVQPQQPLEVLLDNKGRVIQESYLDGTKYEYSYFDDNSIMKEAITYPNGYREVDQFVR